MTGKEPLAVAAIGGGAAVIYVLLTRGSLTVDLGIVRSLRRSGR